MSINQIFIQLTIPNNLRTSHICQTILSNIGKFVESHNYLSTQSVSRKLELMGYAKTRAAELIALLHDSVESAYERGVFIVSSRVNNLTDFNPRSPLDLLNYLKKREPAKFDSKQWYDLICFEDWLKEHHYHHDIVRELAPYFLRHVRASFTKGMRSAANELVH